MSNDKSRSLLGYSLVLLASLGAILTISTLDRRANLDVSGQGYREMKCGDSLSYYRPSKLYNSESRSNSSRAVAYDVILTNLKKARVLFDYQTSVSNADVKIKLINTGDDLIDLSKTKFEVDLSGNKTSYEMDKISIREGEASFVEVKPDLKSLAVKDIKAGFTLSDGSCLLNIDQFATLAREDHQDGFIPGISSGGEGRILGLNSGLNYFGFSDVRITHNLIKQGVETFAYNPQKKSWQKVSVIEPGKGYVAFNSFNKTKDVIFDNPFWTEKNYQSRAVQPGWNLMYNDFNRDISFDEYSVSFSETENRIGFYDAAPSSVSELIKNKTASPDLYLVNRTNLKKIESNNIPDASIFWLYIYSNPKQVELKPTGLDFKLEGVGDTYKPGQNINFNFAVVNLDDTAHEVVAVGITDPCTYGIKVTNQRNEIIYNDLKGRSCPNWPNITTIQSREKINYNYSWRVPNSASGKYKIEAYFDSYRGVLGDPIKKESLINIE